MTGQTTGARSVPANVTRMQNLSDNHNAGLVEQSAPARALTNALWRSEHLVGSQATIHKLLDSMGGRVSSPAQAAWCVSVQGRRNPRAAARCGFGASGILHSISKSIQPYDRDSYQ
jgi:hypothetical protein